MLHSIIVRQKHLRHNYIFGKYNQTIKENVIRTNSNRNSNIPLNQTT